MGLKQAIVVRSEYTNNARSAPGKGSRGASPGQYVMRYMAREDATEVLAPVKQEAGIYDGASFMRYITRQDATEQFKKKQQAELQDEDAYRSPLFLKHTFKRQDKQSGRAFGSKGISLSHEALEESSEAIQSAFDNGHSVQKMIVSFTEEYLRETGVLDPAFRHKGRGSYKGYIDQLKLRQAIMQGVDRMTTVGRYADPEWVGTIQLDTSYVHAHIALVDQSFSAARMREDGADRGKINEREKRMFRKGLHYSLEDMKDLKSFHRQASLERQNVVAFVKDYAYHTLRENTPVQLLMAALPQDRQHWRYGTNRQSMQYPNSLAKDVVEEVFDTEPEASGYVNAMQSVETYAEEAMKKNKLTDTERQSLVDKGRDQIIERSVNGLYRTLKTVDPSSLHIRTTMTDIQSSSEKELAQALQNNDTENFDAAAFTLRVRGYNKRREVHTQQARDYYEMANEYDTSKDLGLADDTAHVMRLYYEEEQRYHMGLVDKYRTFLSFHHPEIREQAKAMRPAYETLVTRFHAIQQKEAEEGNPCLDDRAAYKETLRSYTFDCFERGVASLKEWDAITNDDSDTVPTDVRFVLPIQPKTDRLSTEDPHFRQVKAWDVHHLGLDYYNHPDARIDGGNAETFANKWQSRKQRAEGARLYMEATSQQLPALDRSESDIASMSSAVEKAVQEGLIDTVTLEDLTAPTEGDRRQRYTMALDQSLRTTEQVRTSLEHLDVIEEEEWD